MKREPTSCNSLEGADRSPPVPTHDRRPDRLRGRTSGRLRWWLLAAVGLSCWPGGLPRAAALSPKTTDARAIMQAVYDRDVGDKMSSKMKMVIKDPLGAKRVRVVRSQQLEVGGARRMLVLFEAPADVRNTGLLTIDHDDPDKADDQWLYLPNLRRTMRISSSEKSGAFMGSDLSFADMTRRSPKHYSYKLVKASSRAGGDDCWVIEARPRTKRAKEETGYVKSLVWVSKPKLMLVQAKHWVRKGKKIKLMKFAQVKKFNGVWIAQKILARTLQNRKPLSTTILSFSRIRVGDPHVRQQDFTQRRLEKGL